MEIRVRHWNTAIFAAAALHAMTAAALLWAPAPPGAQLPGIGGIEISLGPAGGAPGDAAQDSPQPKDAEPVEPIEMTEAEPVETVVPETPVETVPVEPVIPDAVAIEPVKPVEQRPREPLPVPPKMVRPARPTPPEPVKTETAELTPPVKAPPPSVAGSQGKAGTKDAKNAGSGDDSQGGGMAGAAADYMSILQAWLEKHKEYPRSARLRRIEGAVLLYFAIDGDGRVLSYRIERSSGHRMLDNETLAMIDRAQPLPPIPADMDRDRLEVVVPVQFSLR
jgi:protein TonB